MPPDTGVNIHTLPRKEGYLLGEGLTSLWGTTTMLRCLLVFFFAAQPKQLLCYTLEMTAFH